MLKAGAVVDILASIKEKSGGRKSNGLPSPSSKTQLMKNIEKQLAVLALVSLVATAGCGQSPEAEKTRADAKAAAEKTADTAKDLAAQGKVIATNVAAKSVEIATNVAAKSAVIATNVASHVKEVTTNVVSEVKNKFNELTH